VRSSPEIVSFGISANPPFVSHMEVAFFVFTEPLPTSRPLRAFSGLDNSNTTTLQGRLALRGWSSDCPIFTEEDACAPSSVRMPQPLQRTRLAKRVGPRESREPGHKQGASAMPSVSATILLSFALFVGAAQPRALAAAAAADVRVPARFTGAMAAEAAVDQPRALSAVAAAALLSALLSAQAALLSA
jgi:hypothetical protein